MATQSSIIWTPYFLPGTTDSFSTNEIIARNLTAHQIWTLLTDTSAWTSYYKNIHAIEPPSSGPLLRQGSVFKISTFGFPLVPCTVEEFVEPEAGVAGRLAWSCHTPEGLEVYHAWIVEDLEGERVRVLTQESQVGEAFRAFARGKPNLLVLGHQDWVEGLVAKARGEEIGTTNLESVGFPVRQPEGEGKKA